MCAHDHSPELNGAGLAEKRATLGVPVVNRNVNTPPVVQLVSSDSAIVVNRRQAGARGTKDRGVGEDGGRKERKEQQEQPRVGLFVTWEGDCSRNEAGRVRDLSRSFTQQAPIQARHINILNQAAR